MSWLLPADHSVLKQTLRRIVPNAHSITSSVVVLLPTSTMFNPHVCNNMLSSIKLSSMAAGRWPELYYFYENGVAYKNACIYKERKGFMTPEQLRDAYNRYIDERKQSYVAKMTNINASTLSSFKNGKFDLYPELHERLETFLNEHR